MVLFSPLGASADRLSSVPPIRVLSGLEPAEGGPTPVSLSTLLADKGEPKAAPTDAAKEGDKSSNELVFLNEGIPPISKKIVLKIEQGEFVEFSDLLPKKQHMEEPSIAELAKEGIVVVTQAQGVRPQKKPIKDVATWVEAFLTFACIRNRKHPKHTNDLLAYGALVVKGARDYRGSGWLSYDFQFRQLAAARGNLGDWGKKDVSLWNDTVCRPESGSMGSTARMGEPSSLEEGKASFKRKGSIPQAGNGHTKKPRTGLGKPEKPWRSSVCFPFSYGGRCTREKCDFLHICYECQGDHAQVACPKKSKEA